MGLRERLNRARQSLTEKMNVLFDRGPEVDDDFWEDLEEVLILSDLGAQASDEIVERLQDQSKRQALPDAYAVLDMLSDTIEDLFTTPEVDPFDEDPVCILFVGINGAGKTTTVGKLANQGLSSGRNPLIGSADTFRAAAIEQLDEWGRRSGVEVVKRERGADPASVCYDVIERAEELGSDLVLIDTSGRLHTSNDLMRELQKVVSVTRKRSTMPVRTVLVIDATTGQNGLQQAREFHKAIELDGIIMTKLDGTAKGGIAVAVSHELQLPILRVGVGEGIEDLQPFVAKDYAEALFGEMRDANRRDEDVEAADEDVEAVGENEPAGAAGDTGTEPEISPILISEPAPVPPAIQGPDEFGAADDGVDEDVSSPTTDEGEGEAADDSADESSEEGEETKKKWWRFW